MTDLFDWTPPPGYPREPGWKESTTSKEAAKAMRINACRLREDLLTLFRGIWPAGMTADEAATKVGRNVLSVRPRITELRKLEQLYPTLQKDGTKQRRANASGMMATVLVSRKPESSDGR